MQNDFCNTIGAKPDFALGRIEVRKRPKAEVALVKAKIGKLEINSL